MGRLLIAANIFSPAFGTRTPALRLWAHTFQVGRRGMRPESQGRHPLQACHFSLANYPLSLWDEAYLEYYW